MSDHTVFRPQRIAEIAISATASVICAQDEDIPIHPVRRVWMKWSGELLRSVLGPFWWVSDSDKSYLDDFKGMWRNNDKSE